MNLPWKFWLCSLVAAIATARLGAAPIETAILGTDKPPEVLGGYDMVAFEADSRSIIIPVSENAPVSDVSAPDGGVLTFDHPLAHFRVYAPWASWSHNYQGDLYYTPASEVTLALPSQTRAFYFYVEPAVMAILQMSVSATNGAAVQSMGTFDINGEGGAQGFGFFVGAADAYLTAITITGHDTTDGFAVGEFGINARSDSGAGVNVPDGGIKVLLLGSAFLLLGAARRRVRI